MAVNSNALAEMEVPESYLDSLPKNGRATLGDIIYSYITSDRFSPKCLIYVPDEFPVNSASVSVLSLKTGELFEIVLMAKISVLTCSLPECPVRNRYSCMVQIVLMVKISVLTCSLPLVWRFSPLFWGIYRSGHFIDHRSCMVSFGCAFVPCASGAREQPGCCTLVSRTS